MNSSQSSAKRACLRNNLNVWRFNDIIRLMSSVYNRRNKIVTIGLCGVADYLLECSDINLNEHKTLLEVLKFTLPKSTETYAWPVSDTQSRLIHLNSIAI